MSLSKPSVWQWGSMGLLLVCAALMMRQSESRAVEEKDSSGDRWVEGFGIVTAVSESGKTAYGFSDFSGRGDKITIEPGTAKVDQMTVGAGVACLVTGAKAYAFGNESGKWSAVDLGAERARATVGNGVVCVVSGTKAYAYGAKSGKWSEVDLGSGRAVTQVGLHIKITVGSKVFLFSSASEEWSVFDASAGS